MAIHHSTQFGLPVQQLPALRELGLLTFLSSIFQAGVLKYFDWVTVHLYEPGQPENALQHIHSVETLVRNYTSRKLKVISGEYGYTTCVKCHAPVSLETQTKYVVRMWLALFVAGTPYANWYEFYCNCGDPTNRECNFGLVSYTSDDKRPATAASTVLHALGDFSQPTSIEVSNNQTTVMAFQFHHPTLLPRLAVWLNVDSNASVTDSEVVTLHGLSPNVCYNEMFINATNATQSVCASSVGDVAVVVSDSPIILVPSTICRTKITFGEETPYIVPPDMVGFSLEVPHAPSVRLIRGCTFLTSLDADLEWWAA